MVAEDISTVWLGLEVEVVATHLTQLITDPVVVSTKQGEDCLTTSL